MLHWLRAVTAFRSVVCINVRVALELRAAGSSALQDES